MRATVELLADSSQIKTAQKDLQALNQTGARTDKSTKQLTKGVRSADAQVGKLGKTARATANDLEAVGKTGKKAGQGFSLAGRGAGQAGIQVQQFVGQVQGGQNAMLALSQQGADLGIVLGAPLAGVIIGLGASLAGFMLPALFNSKDAMEQLEEIAERLGETLSSDVKTGVIEFSDALLGLARRSRVLAGIQIAQSISDASEQIKVAADGINQSVGDLSLAPFNDFNNLLAKSGLTVEQYSETQLDLANTLNDVGTRGLVKYETSLRSLQKEFGLTRPQAIGLAQAIGSFESDKSAAGIGSLRAGLEDLSLETGNGNAKLVKFTADLIPLFQSAAQGVDISNELRLALSGVNTELSNDLTDAGTGFKSLNTTTQGLTASLNAQIIALQSGARAAEIYTLVQRLAGTAQADQVPTLIALIDKKYALSDAQKAAAESSKDEARSLLELERNYSAFLAKLEQAEASRGDRLGGVASGNVGLTKLQNLEQQYKNERDLLNEAQEAGFKSEVSYKERLLQLETKFTEDKRALNNSFELVDFEAFSNRAAGAFATVATGAQTGKEAVQGLALGVIQEGIGSLLKYGITAAATWAADALGFSAAQGVKATAVVAATSVQTGAAVAATGVLTTAGVASGITLAAAYAPAAAAASIATAGAAPAAATPIALGSIGTIIAAIVGGVAVGSTFGRASGGQVREGQSYMVGERGAEMFTPNSSGGGRVTPFNQLMNEARGGNGQSVTDNSNVNINVSGLYQTGEDLLLANRDLIYRIVSDAKRKQGTRF